MQCLFLHRSSAAASPSTQSGRRLTHLPTSTFQVPALDTSADLVGADAAAAHLPLPLAELAAARTMIDYLKHKVGEFFIDVNLE